MACKPFRCFFIDWDSVNVFRSSVKKEQLNINLRWYGSVEAFERVLCERRWRLILYYISTVSNSLLVLIKYLLSSKSFTFDEY